MGITRPRLRFPSPALILSCLALFAAGGGSTYAATSIGGNGTIHFTNAKLKNGWTRTNSSYAPAGYAKDSLGIVHVRGAISGGAGNTPAFVLPSGVRPRHFLAFAVASGAQTAGFVLVFPNGQVRPYGGDVTSFTSLAGITFVAGE
jgi:hypothetical protein